MTGRTGRSTLAAASLVLCGAAVSGCMSAPTYGTDKTSTEQLMGDVSGILSLAPPKRVPIDYKPRPELVKPAKGDTVLPAPQDSIVSADSSAWPESPEQKRARLRKVATENQDNPNFKPQIENDLPIATASQSRDSRVTDRSLDAGVRTPMERSAELQQREQFNKRLAETRQGDEAKRKYLSEPPIAYRQPSDTAPTGDVGEDEFKKERRLKAAARKKGGSSWGDLWPF